MKRFFFVLIAFVFFAAPALRGQDAASEERLNKLNGYVQDLLTAQSEQQKRIAALAKEIESLREQQSQPNVGYATAEALKKLAEKVQEIDKKREADKELILKKIEELAKTLAGPSKKPVVAVPAPTAGATNAPATPEKGFWYVIQSGDTLSVIAEAYREKNIKVTVDQIMKVNEGLNPNRLKVGQKIFIPAPKP
jgi:LysM repeat protein